MPDLRYPIGVFHCDKSVTQEQIDQWIDTIEKTPRKLIEVTTGLSKK